MEYSEELEKLAEKRLEVEYQTIDLEAKVRKATIEVAVAEDRLERLTKQYATARELLELLDAEFEQLANSETAPTGIEAASKQKQTV
jgi:hypothetical protein